jgi:hypothetical protein
VTRFLSWERLSEPSDRCLECLPAAESFEISAVLNCPLIRPAQFVGARVSPSR